MPKSPGRQFYDRQLKYLRDKDIDGLVENQYDPTACLVSFDATVRGYGELRAHFAKYLEILGNIELRSTDKFTETEDSIFFEATVNTQIGVARVYDVFVLREGKATHHFTGVISVEA